MVVEGKVNGIGRGGGEQPSHAAFLRLRDLGGGCRGGLKMSTASRQRLELDGEVPEAKQRERPRVGWDS